MDALASAFGFGGLPKFEPQTFGNALNTFNVGRYPIEVDIDANELKRLRARTTELLRKGNVDEARGEADQLIRKEKHNLAEKTIATFCASIYKRRGEFAAGHKLPADLNTATAAAFWAGARLKKKYPGESPRARRASASACASESARERARARAPRRYHARVAQLSRSLAPLARSSSPALPRAPPQSSRW